MNSKKKKEPKDINDIFIEKDIFGLEKPKGIMPLIPGKPYKLFIGIGIILLLIILSYLFVKWW